MFLLISYFCIVSSNGNTKSTNGGGSYNQSTGKLQQPVGSYGWCAVGYNASSSMMSGTHVNVYSTNNGSLISSHILGNHSGGSSTSELGMITSVVKNGDELHFDIDVENQGGNILYACGSGDSLGYHGMKGSVKAYVASTPPESSSSTSTTTISTTSTSSSSSSSSSTSSITTTTTTSSSNSEQNSFQPMNSNNSNPNAQNENVNQTSSNNDDINVVNEEGKVVTSYSSKCMLHPALIFLYFM